MKNSKIYRLNPNFAYSIPDDGNVNIINLGSDDNLYVLSKVSAKVFPLLVKGKSRAEIMDFILEMEAAPSKDQVESFLDKFVMDLLELKIIQEE